MVTGNGNTDPIPPDMVGRIIWVAKHFGVLAVVALALGYHSYQVSESDREGRKEDKEFVRQELKQMNEKTVEALTNSNSICKQQCEQGEELQKCIERNTDAFNKFHGVLNKQ